MEKRVISYEDIKKNFKEIREEDDDLAALEESIREHYAKAQFTKQSIYGVQIEERMDLLVALVHYKKYRSVEEIEKLGFLDFDERAKMCVEHKKLIFKIFHEFKPNEIDYLYTEDDIWEACFIGFVNACNNYHKSMNIKFITYAYMSMRNSCKDFIKEAKRIKRAQKLVYLDEKIGASGEESSEITLGDTISMDNQSGYLDPTPTSKDSFSGVLENDTFSKTISQLTEGLDYDHIHVLYYHYGVLGYPKLTQLDIARKLHISKPTVSMYIKEVEEHMKQRIYELGITASELFG